MKKAVVELLLLLFPILTIPGICSAENYYLVYKNGKRVNINKILPHYIGEYPIPLEIYIPNAWGGKYKQFNEEYGKIYGRKVLGGYTYSSGSILAMMYHGVRVVDDDNKTVRFLPKTVRETLYYAVAEPSKINDILYEVIRNYIVNDIHENPTEQTYDSGSSGN